MQALGTLATMLAFACLRLWFAAPRKIQTEALPTIASNHDSASSRVSLVGRLVAPFHAWLPRTAIRIPQQISWWFLPQYHPSRSAGDIELLRGAELAVEFPHGRYMCGLQTASVLRSVRFSAI
jgi:hypothetical protein